jgi:hypothetical protein
MWAERKDATAKRAYIARATATEPAYTLGVDPCMNLLCSRTAPTVGGKDAVNA